ncbi:MAG TPA: tetratricopeptide repeat protein [Polyangia bacterium]|nr:tetratricopeptide repeat protein [Polyangia bacterium]
MLHDHTVPRTNLLSFTYPDARDVNLAWLFQIVLALAHRAGGIPGTLLLKIAFVLGALAVLFRVALRRGADPAAAAIALALSAWAAEPRFVERPHLVTFLGLALTLLAVERAESAREEPASSARRVSSREGSGTLPGFPIQSTRPRALYALIPCGLLWANANSCFFLAPVVLALYALGARFDGRGADARRAGLCAAALVPLIFATPSGVHALGYIANHWRMPWLRPLEEYLPARWPDNAPALFVAAGVAVAAVLPGRRWRHLLPVALLGIVGARRNRFLAEFALLSGPIVAGAITDLASRVTGRLAADFRSELRRLATAATLTVLAGAAIVPRVSAARQGRRVFDIGLDPTLVPHAAIAFINENGLRDRMYNDMEVGSYLTWEGWPRHRVFQDPRINGYPPEFHAQLRRDDVPPAAWDALLGRFGVNAALITYPHQGPRGAFFDPETWALVYRADDALVFVRRRPEAAALIARTELPVRFVVDRAAGVIHARAVTARPAGSPVSDCEWQRRLGDFFVETGDDKTALASYRGAGATTGCLDGAASLAARTALGDAALRLHDPATATDAYAGIDTPRAHTNRALALLALGRAEEALAEARRALQVDPTNADALTAEKLARDRVGR